MTDQAPNTTVLCLGKVGALQTICKAMKENKIHSVTFRFK